MLCRKEAKKKICFLERNQKMTPPNSQPAKLQQEWVERRAHQIQVPTTPSSWEKQVMEKKMESGSKKRNQEDNLGGANSAKMARSCTAKKSRQQKW